MKNILQSVSNQNRASARVIDGKLILSFPGALTPVLWQMDLDQARASALEVRRDAGETHTLTLRTARGETLDIAPFASREEAVRGLMAVSKALENAQGQIRPAGAGAAAGAQDNRPAPAKAEKKTGGAGKWAGGILGVLFVIVLLATWNALTPRPPAGGNAGSESGGPATGAGGQNRAGVPLSADEYLKGM